MTRKAHVPRFRVGAGSSVELAIAGANASVCVVLGVPCFVCVLVGVCGRVFEEAAMGFMNNQTISTT